MSSMTTVIPMTAVSAPSHAAKRRRPLPKQGPSRSLRAHFGQTVPGPVPAPLRSFVSNTAPTTPAIALSSMSQ